LPADAKLTQLFAYVDDDDNSDAGVGRDDELRRIFAAGVRRRERVENAFMTVA
jgi:hypothetical protein